MTGNRLCSLLGIEYPIVQAPMNWITGADLAAAVSNAGGLGTLGPNAGARTLTRDPKETGERLREQIRKVKSLTSRPFAVNFAMGAGDAEGEGGAFCQRCVEVALEEGIPAAITSVGGPKLYTRVKQAVIEARDTATVSLKKWVVAGRVLRNKYADKYMEMQESKASMEELLRFLGEHTLRQGLVEGYIEQGEVPCGQNAAMLREIVSAAEVVRSFVQHLPSVMGQLQAKAPAD